MTCSSIGADVLGSSKTVTAFEKSGKCRSETGDSRSNSVSSDKIQTNSMDSNRSTSRNSVSLIDNQSSAGVAASCHSSGHKISFKPYEDKPQKEPKEYASRTNGTHSNNNYSRTGGSDASSPKRSSTASSPRRSSSSASTSESTKNHHSSSSSSSSNVISYTSTGLLELSKNHQLSKAACDSSASGFPSATQLSHFSPAITDHHHDHHSSSHPYNSTASCRDPFCSGCHISSLPRMASAGNCCNGLSNCTHTKATDHPFAGFSPGINPLSHHLNRFSNGVPTQKPFPCHWTANGSYCGKSFSTCEELLQHLKTHTLISNTPSPYSGLGSYYHQALGAACIRSSALEELRYNPYKFSGNMPSAALRPLARVPAATSFPLVPPPLSMYQPGYHPSLSSYYALLNSRLTGPGSLH